MSTSGITVAILTILVPALVGLVVGYIGYRQAVKISDRNVTVETRRVDLSEFEALNRGLIAEVTRLKDERTADDARVREFEERLASLEAREQQEGRRVQELTQMIEQHIAWARAVIRILRIPNVAELLRANAIDIPDPPPGVQYAE